MGPSQPGQLVDTAGYWGGRETSGIIGQPRGPSEPSPSCLGHLVDPTGPRTLARNAREIWSTP